MAGPELAILGAIGSTAGGVASLANAGQQQGPAALNTRPNPFQPPPTNGFQVAPPPMLQAPQQQDLMSILQQISQRSL